MERERATKLLRLFFLCLCISGCSVLSVKSPDSDSSSGEGEDLVKALVVVLFGVYAMWDDFKDDVEGEVVEPPTLPELSVVALWRDQQPRPRR